MKLASPLLLGTLILAGCQPGQDTRIEPITVQAPPANPVLSEPVLTNPVVPTPAPQFGNRAPVLLISHHRLGRDIEGSAPFELEYDLCDSYDPEGDGLVWVFKFTQAEAEFRTRRQCRERYIYTTPGTYKSHVCVTDDLPLPGHEPCEQFRVIVN